jgi:F-type H+-transporting ATPase subunit delta
MRIQPVAYRYAKALLEIASDHGQVDRLLVDAELIAGYCSASEDLRVLLKSPVIRPDQKRRALTKLFEGKLGKVVPLFLDVLLRKGREPLLYDIALATQELGRDQQGIVICKVTTASPMTAPELEQVRKITGPRFPGKTIRIEAVIDPSIIGGGIIQVGDLQWDASVRNKLHVIRRTFAQNPYIPKI